MNKQANINKSITGKLCTKIYLANLYLHLPMDHTAIKMKGPPWDRASASLPFQWPKFYRHPCTQWPQQDAHSITSCCHPSLGDPHSQHALLKIITCLPTTDTTINHSHCHPLPPPPTYCVSGNPTTCRQIPTGSQVVNPPRTPWTSRPSRD